MTETIIFMLFVLILAGLILCNIFVYCKLSDEVQELKQRFHMLDTALKEKK